MWKESVRVHPLDVSPPLSVSGSTSDVDHGSVSDRSFLVHSAFSIDTDEIHTLKEHRLVPAAIRAVLSSVPRLQRLELTYTRGNRGLFRFPSWFADRGSGLVLESRFGCSDKGLCQEDLNVLANIIARLIGCSASSILSRKSFAWYEKDHGAMVGYSTQDFPCVESIAQWMKLLPCGGHQGLSGFMKSLRMLELPYHSLRMILDREKGVRIEVSAVVHKNEPLELLRRGDGLLKSRKPRRFLVERPVEQILKYLQNDDWKVIQCPLVTDSELYLLDQGFLLFDDHQQQGGGAIDIDNSIRNQLVQFDIANGVRTSKREPGNALLGTFISYIRAVGNRFHENAEDSIAVQRVFVRQVMPWEIVCSRTSFALRDIQSNAMIEPRALSWIPSKPREHAGILEVSFDMPQMRNNTWTVSLEVDIERSILSVFDYPADISRGIDIPAPLVCVGPQEPGFTVGELASHARGCDVLLAGQNTLVQLPIPDASMPFNVACFTATLLSLIFGSILSMILWNKSELESFKSAKASPRARIRRLALVLILGGGTLLYVDPSYHAYAESFIEKVKADIFNM